MKSCGDCGRWKGSQGTADDGPDKQVSSDGLIRFRAHLPTPSAQVTVLGDERKAVCCWVYVKARVQDITVNKGNSQSSIWSVPAQFCAVNALVFIFKTS